MSIINVKDLTFSYEGVYDNIFEHTSFQIDTDWKLGFIGRNGRGKTTFLNLLLGKYEYKGSIETSVTFDYFPYEVADQEKLTLEVMKEVIAPYKEWELEKERCINENTEEAMMRYGEIEELYQAHDGYVIDDLIKIELNKLLVGETVLYRSFSTLSKGEQTKVLLIALFLKKNNFLLIDEPTNHLDVEGRKVLAEYLGGKDSFILVSHDRNFLDQCVDHILSINRNTIDVQKGNYSSWHRNKELEDQYEIDKNEKLQKQIAHLTKAVKQTGEWSDKVEKSKYGSGPCDRGFIGHKAAKMMKRSKAIEKRRETSMEEKKGLLQNIETTCDLKMNILSHVKRNFITVFDFSIVYDQKPIFNPISFTLEKGDRMVIKGHNGCGKTSLIKTILGDNTKYIGSYHMVNNFIISYMSQDTSYLKGSIKEYAGAEGVDESLLLTVLRQLDFPRVQFEKNIEDYSAGQKKKVLIAKSLIQPAHLFVWDEPLNYIDVFSREQIEKVILEYKPTMLFVEHDITFVEKIATKEIQLYR